MELKEVVMADLLRHINDLTQSPYMHILFWFIVADILLGYFKAFKTKKFDSRTGTMGILRHILVFSVMTLAGTYLRYFGLIHVSIGLCSFFILNYVGSLMESWETAGLPFPEYLKPYINQLKKDQQSKLVNTLKVYKIEVISKDENN